MFLPFSNYAGKPPRRTLARHFITPLVRPGMLAAWLLFIGVIPVVANAAAPTAVDVYAATQINTSASPQSALVVLEGADIDFDALTYRIVSGPGNGSLSDPGNGDAAVTTGDLAGQAVTYTPNEDFTGTDTFTYRVNDGTADSPVQSATITVFDAHREVQRQLGADIDGEAAGDWSGYSVALSSDGQTAAIGAGSNGGSNAGHVRVYHFNGSVWTQRGGDIDGEAAFDGSGTSVALSSDGQTVAIGATGNDGTDSSAGHVRVYQYTGSAWTQLGADIDGEAELDFSGRSVALSSDGQTVAIGASGNDGTADKAGHVRVYQYTGSTWTQLGADIDGEAAGDQSGSSVALSSDGQTVAIGATNNRGNASVDVAGHVRVYQYIGGIWTQRGADIDGEEGGDGSGRSVALSSDGQTVAVGAINNRGNLSLGNAGHVRVYQYIGGIWTQLGDDIDGEAWGDVFGTSVALSSDGQTVAIGASGNDGNGSEAGRVRVYQYIGGIWTQLGDDIDGEAAGDRLGWSVALSSDGQTMAIGAFVNDGTADDAGHVRVFRLDNLSPVVTGAAGTTATTGIPYLFTPSASDADGDLLLFSITNQPGWTSFDTATGVLSGSPDAGDVGVTSGIVITVTDADGLSAELAAFNLTVFDTDEDEDEDGIGDALDACDNTPPSETGQINGVGCGPSERDTDSDGTNDDQDAFPDNPDEQLDSDGDGYGDNEETEAGSDPNDANDQPISSGLPIWLLHEATK